MDNVLVVIPARLEATRLPNKPLADIAGEPMIVQVWKRAQEADVGRVVVATDSEEVVEVIIKAGGEAVMTRTDHQSGSDRIQEAVNTVDPEHLTEIIINLQGDLPTIEPELIKACLSPLENNSVDIATLAVEIKEEEERTNPNVVKVIGTPAGGLNILRALYFTRATAPYGKGPLFHHIGIYAYRRDALARFVNLEASSLEKREKLEQLRALEAGMRIDVALVETTPLGVDTQEDLEKARAFFEKS